MNPVCPNGKFCSLSCAGLHNGQKYADAARRKYDLNPKKCKHCDAIIAYEDRKAKLKFCSQSCSARSHNERMTDESRKKQSASLKRFNEANPRPKKFKQPKMPFSKRKSNLVYETFPFTRVTVCLCHETGVTFYAKHWRKYCDAAANSNRLVYRQRCSFDFSPYRYPDMEGYDLLVEHGIYHPVSNPTGVSRDHKYSVADGWKHSVDPEIMKHRGNCRLVLHSENNRKNTDSSISLSELLEIVEARVGLEPTLR